MFDDIQTMKGLVDEKTGLMAPPPPLSPDSSITSSSSSSSLITRKFDLSPSHGAQWISKTQMTSNSQITQEPVPKSFKRKREDISVTKIPEVDTSVSSVDQTKGDESEYVLNRHNAMPNLPLESDSPLRVCVVNMSSLLPETVDLLRQCVDKGRGNYSIEANCSLELVYSDVISLHCDENQCGLYTSTVVLIEAEVGPSKNRLCKRTLTYMKVMNIIFLRFTFYNLILYLRYVGTLPGSALHSRR
jgi:hypothetical protein